MPPRRYGPSRRRLQSGAYGTRTLTPLPYVTTMPASALTDTTAWLNGSITTHSLATNYWFAWGTGVPYTYTTPVTPVTGNLAYPQVVGVGLENLVTGTEYHFALVAQSTAGTVYGIDLSFVAQTPQVIVTATNPLQPIHRDVQIPHFQYPLTINAALGANVVEQDSLEDVFACVQAIVECPEGACPFLPQLGVPDLAFSQTATFLGGAVEPMVLSDFVAAVQAQEPRANEGAVAQALRNDADTGDWSIAATTSLGGVQTS